MNRSCIAATAALILLQVATVAWSQTPPKHQAVANPSPITEHQVARDPNTNERPTAQSPLPVQIIQSPTDATHADAREAKADRHDEENLSAQVRTAVAAEKQLRIGWIASALSTVGTLLLVWTLLETRKSSAAARVQAESFIHSERAYVKLSHVLPGVKLEGASSEVALEVKNWGKTPSHVTDVRLGVKYLAFGEALPDPYPYESADRDSFPNAFLVPGEFFTQTKYFNGTGASVMRGQLWVFGHVDYQDVFGQRWRGGYARKFADRKGDNLIYNTEGRDNFDRKRIPGEGNDW